MTRKLLCLPLAALAACRAPAADAPFAEGTRAATLQAGLLRSPGDDARDIRGASGRVGLEQRFRDGFAVAGELDVTHFDASPDATGAGLSALLRWHALRGERWSAFLEYGYGFLATDGDFPPGGTPLNGTRQAGLGLSVAVADELFLTLGARQQHVSNGKGLVPENPSWDGWAAYLGLALDVSPPATGAPARGAADPVEPWPVSVRVDARGGEVGDASGAGALAAVDAALGDALGVQVRGAVDAVDGESLGEWGLAVYARGDRGRAGLAFDRQTLGPFADEELSAFGELFANDAVTVAGALGFEHRNRADDRLLGGAFLRLYPFESLAFTSGIAFRETAEDLGPDSVDVPVALEWSPGPLADLGLSVFAQDGFDESRGVGVRWVFGGSDRATRSLRDRHRAAGPLRERP